MTRRVLLAVGLFVLAVAAVPAQPPAAPPPPDAPPAAKPEELSAEALARQKRLKEQYQEFEAALARVAQRLERSDKPEDKKLAAALNEALDLASKEGVEKRFETIIRSLQQSQGLSDQDVKPLLDKNLELVEVLDRLIAILSSQDEDARRRDEIRRLSDLLRELDKVIFEQKRARFNTEAGRSPGPKLSEEQKKITGDTKRLEDFFKKDAKPGEAKPGEPKPGQPKPGEPKPGEPKPGQPQQPQQQQQQQPGQKPLQDAVKNQQRAEQNLQQNQRPKAAEDQDRAIRDLTKAREELEKRLRQLREEERMKRLQDLEARVRAMLKEQREVYDLTRVTGEAVAKQPERKPTRAQQQQALSLGDREKTLADMARDALELLKDEGSSVAFALGFRNVRSDMVSVQKRLTERTDVGPMTQTLEQRVVLQLEKMLAALQKAQQDLKNPPPPPPGDSDTSEAARSLINRLNELKLIREMQVEVNDRTKLYYDQDQAEQANDPQVAFELRELARRQQEIYEATRALATGKNR